MEVPKHASLNERARRRVTCGSHAARTRMRAVCERCWRRPIGADGLLTASRVVPMASAILTLLDPRRAALRRAGHPRLAAPLRDPLVRQPPRPGFDARASGSSTSTSALRAPPSPPGLAARIRTRDRTRLRCSAGGKFHREHPGDHAARPCSFWLPGRGTARVAAIERLRSATGSAAPSLEGAASSRRADERPARVLEEAARARRRRAAGRG